MVLSLVSLCAREVVSDHSSSPSWLRWVPRELYRPLLEAAFSGSRPLAVGELVQRWPERTLRVGGRRKQGQTAPNRLCIQALLLAVVRGLSDQRCALQVVDLCGLQGDEGGMGDPMGGWSLTVALCTMVVQARAGAQRAQRREGERERKRFSALEREKDVKRERGQRKWGKEPNGEEANTDNMELVINEREMMQSSGVLSEEELIKGVRRRMETERKRGSTVMGVAASRKDSEEKDMDSDVFVHVRADLFVNARSWERVRVALSTMGPLKLQCRYLRVEEISVSSIRSLLELLPRQGLLGVDVRYSSLGVAGLAELLPLIATFPALNSLRLHYCNLDFRRDHPGQEEALRDLSQGLTQLQQLRRLSLTALRLPGQLRVLLSHHASTLQQLDLSENRLDEITLPSIRRLLSQASSSLQHLSLSGCGLTDGLLGLLLPSLGVCSALKSLAFALNPLSLAGLLDLVRTATRIPSLRHLLYPNPLEDYQPGLPDLPSSAQLLDWPLDEATDINATSSQLNKVLIDSGRSDLFLTCDLLNYDKDLLD
eukprot:superscaffoldBa00006132_g21182